jgi:hypothetical protein
MLPIRAAHATNYAVSSLLTCAHAPPSSEGAMAEPAAANTAPSRAGAKTWSFQPWRNAKLNARFGGGYPLRSRHPAKGRAIVNASECTPFSTCHHVTGAAIGNPGRARGEYAPTAVVPRPLRR